MDLSGRKPGRDGPKPLKPGGLGFVALVVLSLLIVLNIWGAF